MPRGWRCLSGLTLFLSLVILVVSTASASSAVLGVDFGTGYIKAALVKPGIPLEIVLTKDSKRKETSAVAFKPLKSGPSLPDSNSFPERVYGGDALALSARFPSDVYSNLKPLLGLPVEENDLVTEYRVRHPSLNVVRGKEWGSVGFKSESFGMDEEAFLVEELLAMQLQNIRSNAESLAGKGSRVQDVVITVPAFYTADEKKAVELAADLAGLRTLSLISDGLSVGLNYAASRTFASINDGAKPEYHLVYDMGAGSTTASVIRFQGRTVKDVGKFNKTIQEVHIVGIGWDRTQGGDALNALILSDMVEKFTDHKRMKALEVTQTHIKEHGRTMAKLWKEAERIRHVLSANTETSTSFEGLYYDDVTFKYKLSRADFEKLASDHAERVGGPIKQALAAAKLSLIDLESVILHGGAVRTPFVQKQLESIVGDASKLRTNVNADEAAVFGAAFKAAAYSASFRVKDIRATDCAGYAVGASWVSDGKEKQQKLFYPASQVGVEKQVHFKVTEDFSFNLYQYLPLGGESFVNSPLLTVKTQNLTASVISLAEKFGCDKPGISTKFSIRLNAFDGLPEVVQGVVSCEAASSSKGVVDDVKGFFGFGSKKGTQEPLAAAHDAELTASSSGSASSTTLAPIESETALPLDEPEPASGKKIKDPPKTTESIYVDFIVETAGRPGVSSEEIKRMKSRLDAFDDSDRSRMLREEALNTLEGFTYKARDIVRDEGFITVSTVEQRSEIEEKARSASEWLYGEGSDASRDDLKTRLKQLRGLVDPVQKRLEEVTKRPEEVQRLKEVLNQTRSMVDMLKQQSDLSSSIAASSSTSSSITSTTETVTAPTSTIDDDFAGLDDEPISSSSSATSTVVTKMPEMPSYTAEEIAAVIETHTSIQEWLETKLSEQEKMSAYEDPILLSAEVSAKQKELQRAVMKLMQKKPKVPPKPKASKPKTSSAKKAKTAKTAKSSAFANDELDDLMADMPGAVKAKVKAGASKEDIMKAIQDEMGGAKATEKGNGDDGKQDVHDEL